MVRIPFSLLFEVDGLESELEGGSDAEEKTMGREENGDKGWVKSQRRWFRFAGEMERLRGKRYVLEQRVVDEVLGREGSVGRERGEGESSCLEIVEKEGEQRETGSQIERSGRLGRGTVDEDFSSGLLSWNHLTLRGKRDESSRCERRRDSPR